MKLTFVDSGVLIAAGRGTQEVSDAAMSILDDPEREFASSNFIKLEVLPKSIYHHKANETAFYLAYFEAVEHWPQDRSNLVEFAIKIAILYGLSAMDALHIAAAEAIGATEFVTTELEGKPMFRVKSMKVISISSAIQR